ncbi:MAG: dockerin type I repeat-containing protein [Patescibacteria group bacterium]
MNVLSILFLVFSIGIRIVYPQPIFAVSGAISITALVPEVATSTTFSSPSGGSATLTKADGTTVVFHFPPHFYTEDLKLQANSYSKDFFSSDKPSSSGKSAVGKTYDFNLYTSASGIQVSTTSLAMSITISYTDADISGLDESSIAPYRWGSTDSSWQLIPGATIDAPNNKITFSTNSFSSFVLFALASQQQGGESAGGGGGGGIVAQPQTAAVFSGRAYPKSTVTLLKDAQIAATTIAGSDASFSIKLSGLSTGNYIFALYSKDSKGNRSSLVTFPASVASGATTSRSGIFITPTIAVDKSEVKRGENIAIFGQSVPKADVTVAISSEEEFLGKTVADQNGAYLYNFDTAELSMGQHFAKSKAARNGTASSFSHTISFLVGAKTVVSQPTNKCQTKGDFTNDCRVNLVDFSIAAYWYKRPSPPNSTDLNNDGKVDLVDLSIMTFHWTG